MADRRVPHVSRRAFLKGSVAAGALLELNAARIEALHAAPTAAGIRTRDWYTLPLNDGRTIEASANDVGGDL